MPQIDFTDDELQQLIQIVATGSGPGINWIISNGLLTKIQAAAQKQPMISGEQPPSRAPLNEQMQYDATTRPLEPPHRRRANSDDRG